MTMVEAKVIDPLPTPREAWNGITSTTQGIVILMFAVIAIIGGSNGGIQGVIGAIIIAYIIYYLLGPWAAEISEKHNRSENWAYFYVVIGSFIALLMYWIYVKLTKDPIGDE